MSDHARLSPSAASRWFRCPGSVREEAKYERTSGPAAVDGTHTHTLVEKCINNGLMDPVLMVGTELSDDDGKFTVDIERAKRVLVMINYIRGAKTESSVIWAERKVDAGQWIGRDDINGTADCIIYDKDAGTLEIIDYKDGMVPVAVEGNPQLMIYALGAIRATLVEGEEIPYKNIRITVIQPKLVLKGMDAVSYHEITIESLMAFKDELVRYASETDDPDAPLVPGEAQCKWCDHKGACTAMVTKSLDDSGISFEDVSKQAADKEPTDMTDEQIKEIMEAAPLIKQMLEGVAAEAQRRLESGIQVSGLKMVRGRGTRKWSLDEEEMADKLKRMGLPKGVIYPTKLISPAQAKKVVWEKKDGTKKQLSERQIKTMETNYITQGEGKLTVALESDHREAVVVGAADMFAPVVPVQDLPDWMK